MLLGQLNSDMEKKYNESLTLIFNKLKCVLQIEKK